MKKSEEIPDARIEREKQYHNNRFSEETRAAQEKYYAALRDCMRSYRDEIALRAEGKDVLEYGCAMGDMTLKIAPRCKRITGIDVSEVAIEKARHGAANRNLDNTVFHVMNAEAMDLANDGFDLVFGSGIIHHLDLRSSFSEISRVLKPGGTAIFVEPLGTNVLFNAYRRLTPGARTPDEHPLQRSDFTLAKEYFAHVNCSFYGLTSLLSVPFRQTSIFDSAYRLTRSFDDKLFTFNALKWQAWYVLMRMEKGRLN